MLEKEKAELQQRLADLRRSQAFLHDIRELNQQYLDYRQKHPKEKETVEMHNNIKYPNAVLSFNDELNSASFFQYGASSLPALLLETKHIKTAERKET